MLNVRIFLFLFLSLFTSQSFGTIGYSGVEKYYKYDAVAEHDKADVNIEIHDFSAVNHRYDDNSNLSLCCSNQWDKINGQQTREGYFFALVSGFNVAKNSAPFAKQKQAGHVKGTPQNANRQKANKPTSTFFGEKSGERLTQEAFQKNNPAPGRPGVKDHDVGVSVGTGSNGGMQTRVRVHQDKKGRIHGHPSGPELF